LFVRLERIDANGGRSIVDGALADFHGSHREGLDDPMDILKLRNGISQGALWFSAGGRILSVQGLPWPTGDTRRVLPIDMAGMGVQSFVLSIDPQNLTRPGLRVWLRDRLLGKTVELRMSGLNDYAFSTTGVTSNDSLRFEILFDKLPPGNANGLNAEALRRKDSVELRWELADDDGVRYELQRSADRESFSTLHATKADPAKGGIYHWIDPSPLGGTAYYRVKATASDGQAKYSTVMRVAAGPVEQGWTSYPNPFDGTYVRLKLKDVEPGRYRVVLADGAGRMMTETWIDHAGGDAEHPIDIPHSLRPGSYLLKVVNGSVPVTTMRMVRK
jgi:hypothetical protein